MRHTVLAFLPELAAVLALVGCTRDDVSAKDKTPSTASAENTPSFLAAENEALGIPADNWFHLDASGCWMTTNGELIVFDDMSPKHAREYREEWRVSVAEGRPLLRDWWGVTPFWRFLPVEGVSELPVGHREDGTNVTSMLPVTMPKFWIAERMVTEWEFARLMGRKIRKGREGVDEHCSPPVTDIEWEDALEYCDRFTEKFVDQLPAGFYATLPHESEWTHAWKVLDGKANLPGDVGTFLFTMSELHGVMRTYGAKATGMPEDHDPAFDMVLLGKRMKSPMAGLRPVLVGWDGCVARTGTNVIGNTNMERGYMLAEFGLFDKAERHYGRLLESTALTPRQKGIVSNNLEYVAGVHDRDFEDWSGLVAKAAAFAEAKGFMVEPFATQWQELGNYRDDMADADMAAAYSKTGIVGEWMRIGDLPESIRKDQTAVGGKDYLLIYVKEEGEPYEYEYAVTESNSVQVLKCDFTGDGRQDMVVEDFRDVGSDGFHYSFYEALPDGMYTNVADVQLVGLCALPSKDGGACGFIVVGKDRNPVLTASLMTIEDREVVFRNVNDKPFYMIDAEQDRIYRPAPFIGAGYGLGWRHLESRGVWYRPLFWPWKQGEVQGYAEAVREAQAASRVNGGE